MTSSGTGQSSSVDVTHSLWRMTNPPCRIVPLLPLMTLYVWGTDVSSCSFSDVQIMATYGRWLGLALAVLRDARNPSRRAPQAGHARLRMRCALLRTRLFSCVDMIRTSETQYEAETRRHLHMKGGAARRSSPTASERNGRGSASRARVTAAHPREDR